MTANKTEQRLLGDRLRQARQRRGWTQQQLAAAAGVGRATIARAELGAFEPRQETMRKLAATLAVRLAWLLTGEGPMDREEG